jgi:hypothetical protein
MVVALHGLRVLDLQRFSDSLDPTLCCKKAPPSHLISGPVPSEYVGPVLATNAGQARD